MVNPNNDIQLPMTTTSEQYPLPSQILPLAYTNIIHPHTILSTNSLHQPSSPIYIPPLHYIKFQTYRILMLPHFIKCSIRNKTDVILELFIDLNLDIMCITEQWLTLNDTPIVAALDTHTLGFVYLPRPSTHFGGGL